MKREARLGNGRSDGLPPSATLPIESPAKQFDVTGGPSNWIHLDFKGMIPSEPKLLVWLKWIREHGFSGVVMEYEDRLPWETFPGAYRPGFDSPAWERVWAACGNLGLEIIPLIQTYGHLEWLLKHKSWSSLRCGGHLNLLCPENAQARSLLVDWIEEVARLHPTSTFIHVGLDEVHHMGACPACQKRAGQSQEGAAEVLLNHAKFVCAEVRKAGKHPMAWADMFGAHSHTMDLPGDVLLCEWNYRGVAGADLKRIPWNAEREIMAASAIRCSFPTYQLMGDLESRVENVRSWHRTVQAEAGAIKILLHTVWGRYRSLGPIYGPWEAWLPAFQVAGQPDQPLSPPIQKGMTLLKEGFSTTSYDQIESVRHQLRELHSEDSLEEAALRWWEFSLRHHAELGVVQYYTMGRETMRSAFAYLGEDENLLFDVEDNVEKLLGRIDVLEKEVSRQLAEWEWSDREEYLDSRFGAVRRVLQAKI